MGTAVGAELPGQLASAISDFGVLGKGAKDLQALCWNNGVNAAVGGKMLAIPAPADPNSKWITGKPELDSPAQTMTGSVHQAFPWFKTNDERLAPMASLYPNPISSRP